ncbi:MAG: hypothetical protein HQL71_00310 [Magnetococcales bacterium]|nr:hypothetical protein [Magnetococcales bacterium]
MPDLFTHFVSGYIPGESNPKGRNDALLVTGAVLPDILSRIPQIVFGNFMGLNVTNFFGALHTPAGFGLFCYLLAHFFPADGRKKVFTLLFAGSLLHFILDLMQAQFNQGVYMPFFPFSFKTTQWGIFHYNDSLYLFPVLLAITIFTYWRRRVKTKL